MTSYPPSSKDRPSIATTRSHSFTSDTDDGYLLYSAGENGEDEDGSNGTMQLIAGRPKEELDSSELERLEPTIPVGADDISVRIPRPPFKLPKIKQRGTGS